MKLLARLWHDRTCGCHRTEGRKLWAGWARLLLPLISTVALAWFLFRVIPKPIRATYPCQQAAFPLASSLILWMLGLKGGLRLAGGFKARLQRLRPALIAALALAASGLAAWAIVSAAKGPIATAWTPIDAPNSPMGVARGIFPGRVTWARDPAATPWDGSTGRWWYDDTGVNQAAVERMMSRSLRALTGSADDAGAWDKIFRYYNTTHGRGEVGYQSGEAIALKINCNNCYSGYTDTDNHVDASPQSVLAMLRQLVHHAGVPQSMITVYEAVRVVPDRIYNKCRAEFPNVVWVDSQGNGSNGRQPVNWHANAFNYSTNNSNCGNSIPACVHQATYLINMAILKGHWRAGVSLTAKNHFGTITPPAHGSIPATSDYVHSYLFPMGVYHPFVDLIGTRHLGGKTVLFMIDGLYGVLEVQSYVEAATARWTNLFGGQWSASYFMSFDPVAIDSVGLDFLRSEFGDRLASGHNANADNFMHEAALADNPPSQMNYRPDGATLTSLGVHEHWNNAVNKQYSRNLNPNATGIELVVVSLTNGISVAITNPADGAQFVAGANVPLEVTASSSSSLIRRVDFFGNGFLLGQCTNSPFHWVWSNAPAGNWALSAIATDSDALSATSAVVNITLRTNSPPELAAVGARFASVGLTLTVTNVATDPDAPPQHLFYSLLTAPAGAVIGLDSGVISWRPGVAQAGMTHPFSVRVADDGLPSLSATQDFQATVHALARPRLTAITVSGGLFRIAITGDHGPDYSIQVSTNLSEPGGWTTVFTTNSPPLPLEWEDPDPAGGPHRFYRTLLGP